MTQQQQVYFGKTMASLMFLLTILIVKIMLGYISFHEKCYDKEKVLWKKQITLNIALSTFYELVT